MDGLVWKVKHEKRHGVNRHEETQAAVDPWSLKAVKLASLKLAASGWRPVTEEQAEATGAGAGYATLSRIVGETAEGRTEQYWLFGCVVFLNEARNVALHVEILPGAADRRATVDDALEGVRTVPLGLRWMGSIVPSGPALWARVNDLERAMALQYKTFVADACWVQVPYYDRNSALRMSNTKIKQALAGVPVHRKAREVRVRLEIQSRRTGTWRIGRARPVKPIVKGTDVIGLEIGPHGFHGEVRDDGYVYLTVAGGVETTYRLKRQDYDAATSTKGTQSNVEETVR